jgi:hypothetical protein
VGSFTAASPISVMLISIIILRTFYALGVRINEIGPNKCRIISLSVDLCTLLTIHVRGQPRARRKESTVCRSPQSIFLQLNLQAYLVAVRVAACLSCLRC